MHLGSGRNTELDLKPLPPYLSYTFLKENETLHVIVPTKLNEEQDFSLVNLLKKRIKTLRLENKCYKEIYKEKSKKWHDTSTRRK